MLLRVSPDLSELVVCAEQAEQETILGASQGVPAPLEVWRCERPVLLTDTARIAALEPRLRDAVLALYESYPRTVSYDGTSLSWSPTEFPRVWTANIDTLFFARTLRHHLDGVRSFAEIGCGSGFLTKYALMRGVDIERAFASDISLAAIRCTSATIAEVSHRASVSLVCPQADDAGFSIAGPFDLVICNPPYIPRPGEGHDNPYEGLALIARLA
ncbi:MAG TPA: methyltransferase [Candidatus Dormibacteraeota bacterium]